MVNKRCIYVLSLLLFFSGCSVYSTQPETKIKGEKVVCILRDETKFKTGVVENVSNYLAGKGCRVVTGRAKQAKFFNPADYGAVVYMAELWAWHTPWHAVRYYKKHNDTLNIIFVITSGDPDVVIKEPFNAVTSASNPGKVNVVSKEIIYRLDAILK